MITRKDNKTPWSCPIVSLDVTLCSMIEALWLQDNEDRHR